MKHHRAQRWDFIQTYLTENLMASIVDQDFHTRYHRRFPKYKVEHKNYGAEPVSQAMRDLKDMYKSGLTVRYRIPIEGGFGFPNWVWVYQLLKCDNSSVGQSA